MIKKFLDEEEGIRLDICNDLLEGKNTDIESIARINERIIAVDEVQRYYVMCSYWLTTLSWCLCLISAKYKLNVFLEMIVAGCLVLGLIINIRYLRIADSYRSSYQRLKETINN